MTKKKNTSAKRNVDKTIAQRYQNIAGNLVENITALSEIDHIALSLVKSELSPSGKTIKSRSDVILRKDGDRVIELPSSESLVSFSERLGTALRNSEKDAYHYDLLAAFFHPAPEQSGKTALETPEFVYQWVIKNKTLSSEITLGDAWNEVSCIPGPRWSGTAFEKTSLSGLNPDDFTDDEITDAGLLVTRFFEGIAEGASTGSHRLEAKSAAYPEPVAIVFHKDENAQINVEQSINAGLSLMSAMIIRNGNFSATLHSFIKEDIKDDDGLMRPESEQEIRAWAVATGDIYALSAKQIIDAYCRDFATGTIMETPPNIAYLSAWKINP